MAKKKPAPKADATPARPTQVEVAFRALALVGLLGRAQGELEIQQDPDARTEWKGINERIVTWMKDEGITKNNSPVEKKMLAKQLGRWTETELTETIWRTEALAALLWALGKLKKMPVYTEQVRSMAVLKTIPINADIDEFIRTVKLRPRKEIAAERDTAEFWHWRARTHMLRMQGFTPPDGDTFEACIKRAAQTARKEKFVSKLIASDVPARGKAYGKLTVAQFAEAYSVSRERHFALNWLCGNSDDGDWDTTRTDT